LSALRLITESSQNRRSGWYQWWRKSVL